MASLGSAIPPSTAHAISVSLPTWRDNVGYEEGERRVIDAMVTGYPRFFIHRSIQKVCIPTHAHCPAVAHSAHPPKLANICEQKFGTSGERCLLLPTKRIAEDCRSFIQDRCQSESPPNIRLIHFVIFPENKQSPRDLNCRRSPPAPSACADLHIVLFPADIGPVARQFWQHAGLGISSRLAEHCLSMFSEDISSHQPPSPALSRPPSKPMNRHYVSKSFSKPKGDLSVHISPPSSPNNSEALSLDQIVYVEERYGRNLPLSLALSAKQSLRRRIAGVLIHDNPTTPTGDREAQLGPSTRGVAAVAENDVFLYPSGMAAIWSAHQLVLSVRPPGKSVCFGFVVLQR
jgi:cystathionine gamma-synthase